MSFGRALVASAAGIALAYVVRAKLVELLTTATGTWVGSPSAPRRSSGVP